MSTATCLKLRTMVADAESRQAQVVQPREQEPGAKARILAHERSGVGMPAPKGDAAAGVAPAAFKPAEAWTAALDKVS